MELYEESILIMPKDLNHHNTFFAGEAVKQMIKIGLLTVCKNYSNPQEVVFYLIKEFKFLKPISNGSLINFTGKIEHLGNSSITVSVTGKFQNNNTEILKGLFTYVIIDEKTKTKKNHNLKKN